MLSKLIKTPERWQLASFWYLYWESSIYYIRKIFRKPNIPNRYVRVLRDKNAGLLESFVCLLNEWFLVNFEHIYHNIPYIYLVSSFLTSNLHLPCQSFFLFAYSLFL